MKKVLRLVGVQIWALVGDMFSIGDIKKKRPKALYAGIVLFFLAMGSIAFLYCYMIGKGLMMYNSIDILPPLVMAVTSIIVLLTTIFKVKGTIFGFRDYDMVMSLPVSTGGIVASRVILLYGINLMFVLMIMIPMMAAYGILANPELIFYITGGICILFLPLIPIILASVLGTLVTYVASRFRHTSLVSIIISLGVIAAVVGLSFMTKGSGQEMVNIGRNLTEQTNSIYPLAELYTKAVCYKDLIAFAQFILISLAAFVLYSYIIGKMFRKMNSAVMAGTYRTNFKMGELRTSTPLKALYVKELKRYFSSPLYVLNTGIGVVMLTIGAIALIFIEPEKLFGDPQAASMLFMGGPVFLSFCVMMSCTTMASISLEGRNLWIIKSLPVPAGTIFRSKLLVNLTIISPALIDAVLISIFLDMGFVKAFFMVLVTIVCSLFTSLFGLLVNLKLPNFTWTTEVLVIKQSAASLISIFTGIGVAGLQAVLLYAIHSFVPTYLIYVGLIALVDLLLYRTLMSYGTKRFLQL
jgi:ABC-2 type transport system permease protein